MAADPVLRLSCGLPSVALSGPGGPEKADRPGGRSGRGGGGRGGKETGAKAQGETAVRRGRPGAFEPSAAPAVFRWLSVHDAGRGAGGVPFPAHKGGDDGARGWGQHQRLQGGNLSDPAVSEDRRGGEAGLCDRHPCGQRPYFGNRRASAPERPPRKPENRDAPFVGSLPPGRKGAGAGGSRPRFRHAGGDGSRRHVASGRLSQAGLSVPVRGRDLSRYERGLRDIENYLWRAFHIAHGGSGAGGGRGDSGGCGDECEWGDRSSSWAEGDCPELRHFESRAPRIQHLQLGGMAGGSLAGADPDFLREG